MKRSEAEALVETLGGKVSKSVNKKLDFLVTGEKSGSKRRKGREAKD